MLWVLIRSTSPRHFIWIPTCFHGDIRKISALFGRKKGHLIWSNGDKLLIFLFRLNQALRSGSESNLPDVQAGRRVQLVVGMLIIFHFVAYISRLWELSAASDLVYTVCSDLSVQTFGVKTVPLSKTPLLFTSHRQQILSVKCRSLFSKDAK